MPRPEDPRERAYRDYLKQELPLFEQRLANCECPRENLQNFELVRVYGQGGFGRVFEARRKGSEHEVALKMQRKSALVRKQKVHLAIQEKRLQWALHSNFTVPLLAAFKDPTNVYLVMEFAALGSLDKQIYSENGLPDAALRLIAAMIVLGVEYLHACNVLYRDLKPENVFVYPDGYVKLGDFGLSMRSTAFVADFMGTVPYMAPEMFHSKQSSTGVDWWAFGVTLYEMYSQEWVFGADPDGPMAPKLVGEAIPIMIHSCVPNIACELVEAVLVKDVDKRLGCLKEGSGGLKSHKFFEGINFLDLHDRLIKIDVGALDEFQHKVVGERDFPSIGHEDKYEVEFRDF